MKKITSLFLMAFLLVGTLAIVAAEENETATDDIEIPEAKRIGFWEAQFDRLGMAFTFNKEKKIEKILEVAEKHLAEAEALAEEDPEAYAQTQEEYDRLVVKAEEVLTNIENGADNVNDSEENMGKVARIQAKFERHRDRIDAMYVRALNRFELNNASDEKIARFEMFHERALNRTDKMETRILERRENIIRKHKALSEMNETEIEDMLARVEKREGLVQAREKRTEHFEIRVEKLEQLGLDRIDRIQQRLESGSLTEEEQAMLTQRIEDIQDRVEKLENATPLMQVPKRLEAKASGIANVKIQPSRIEGLKRAAKRQVDRKD